ncbi:MAG: hypothetical protein HKN48_11645 [Flavobacteriaceae bacterium]|nr:hypothetical protein [Flavobacteriaceae bacterium]
METKYLLYIINCLEFSAAITATVYYSKYIFSSEKYFLFFLWYTFFVDLLGASLRPMFGMDNYWLYNAFTITSLLFYFYWYYTILKSHLFRKWVVFFTIVFSAVAVFSLFYQSWNEYHKYTFVTGALFVLVLTVFHFYKLLNSDEVLIVKYKLSFWISTALLLFYMGMIPLMFLTEFLDISGISYKIIIVSLNLILYGCYIIGFVWTKKKYNGF